MKKYKFEKYHQWTSYSKLSAEESDAIDKANYDRIPENIVLPNGEHVDIMDSYCFSERRTSTGYAIVNTSCGEIRIKIEENKSPNYSKPNGNGSCYTFVTIATNIEGISFL